MRQYIVFFLLFTFPLFLIGQDDSYLNDNTSLRNSNLFSANTALNFPLSPVNATVSTGINISNHYIQSFISPSLAFPVNKKLAISAGISYSNINFKNLPSLDLSGTNKNISGELHTLTMSASAIYQVNNKLHFTGSMYKTINPSFNSRLNPEALQMEARGMSVGIGYQLNENTFIGAEVRMEQGNSNFYNPSLINPLNYYNRSYYPNSTPFFNQY